MTNEEIMTPYDYVYLGEELDGAKKRCGFGIIQDGKIINRLSMAYSRNNARRIGFVYRGASFNADFSRGLGYASAVYVEQWHDQADIVEWKARQTAMEKEQNLKKIEQDLGLQNALETAMIPLRDIHAKLATKRDHAGCMALEHAVLLALRTPVREREKK